MALADSPKWTGNSISQLSLHRRAPLVARLDAIPFAALYVAVLSYVWVYSVTKFVAYALLATSVTLHVLAFLIQHWSVKVRAFMSWITVRRVDPSQVDSGVLYALVTPREYKGKSEMVQVRTDDRKHVYFEFQKRVYEYNANENTFEKIMYPTMLPLSQYKAAARATNGLSGEHLLHTITRYGSNKLEMPSPTFAELYKESLLAPFFVFQVFCVFLWLLDEYWKYSLMTLVMMLVFEATVVFGRLRSLQELRGMRNPSQTVLAFRNKKWAPISSLELLPGDIISIGRGKHASHVVPCDLLILSGAAVVNEAMLTGESVPLMKEAVPLATDSNKDETLDISGTHKSFALFGGTRILTHTPATVTDSTPATKAPDGGCVCFVLRTGFGSAQGKLMRTILYSTESVSANSHEAALFILFLLVFAIAASAYVLYHRYTDDADGRYKLLLRCVLIITSVVPPELPMQLALAVNTSLVSLVKAMVFCTEPYRIPYAGKVDICCFDKTGTITTDAIKAAGVTLPFTGEVDKAAEPTNDGCAMMPVHEASIDAALVLATCHSLVHVDNEVIGDPLELAALESVQWIFGRSGTCVPKRGGASVASGTILQRFRFASSLQRMSVIAKVAGSATKPGPRVLVKGSPEAVGRLLAGGVLPEKYSETARRLAREGMRVLALAHKELDAGMTASQLTNITREAAESELTFVGFVCYECPLRSDSRKVVRMLRKSNHMVTMITGDATLTAAHVATQVEMCSKSILILDKSEANPGTLEWFSANSGKRKKRFSVETISDLAKDFDLCISGPALQIAMDTDVKMKSKLSYIKVYARMSPDQKEHVLTALKEAGLTTLMCGDGTNDVGALKQAHVGVALLSTTEANGSASTPRRNVDGGSQITETGGRQGGSGSRQDKRKNLRQRKRTNKTTSTNDQSAAKDTDSGARNKTAQELQLDAYKKKVEELTGSLGAADDQPPLVKLGDASIASPFTSRRMTIDSCVSIIRQGRCTLATTLQMYQILALNCLISAYSLSVMYLQGVMLGDKQMTIIGFVLAIASFMVSRSKPLKKLSPQRPASTVFAPELFFSLMGQFAVHVLALIACMRLVEPYLPANYAPSIDEEFAPSLTNTVVFLLSIAQQISVFVLNYKGRPYMQGIRDNKPFLNSLLAAGAILLICTAEISRDLNDFMELVPWPSMDLQLKVTTVIVGDLVGSFIFDRLAALLFRPRMKDSGEIR